jgi:hypothetical protein
LTVVSDVTHAVAYNAAGMRLTQHDAGCPAVLTLSGTLTDRSIPMEPRPSHPVRCASTALRSFVDDAVGPGYDAPFLRLDLLLAGRESRCGCDRCAAAVTAVLDEILASLPRL